MCPSDVESLLQNNVSGSLHAHVGRLYDAKRMLREIKLLKHFNHENVPPPEESNSFLASWMSTLRMHLVYSELLPVTMSPSARVQQVIGIVDMFPPPEPSFEDVTERARAHSNKVTIQFQASSCRNCNSIFRRIAWQFWP